jgi:nitroreductase
MRVLPPPAGWPAGPGPLAADEIVSYAVTAAVWAPSEHNSQPWRFGACGQEALAAVEPAGHAQRLSGEHVQELARWAIPSGSARPDGVPPTCYPAREERTAGVVCLPTTGDRPADWVNAGQAPLRVLLTGAACAVAAALHSRPLELPWLRELIRTGFSNDAYPQMVLRPGTVIQTSASVRRPPAGVLSAGASHG